MAEFPEPATSPVVRKSAPVRPASRTIVNRLLPVLRVILAGAILIGLIRWIGPEEVLKRIAACPLPAAVAAFAIALLIQWVGGVRLWLLARSRHFPLSSQEALAINLATVTYGLVLPGGSATGWIVRLLRLSNGLSQVRVAVWILSCDRVFATAIGATIGLIAGVFVDSPLKPAVSLLLLAIALSMGAVIAILFVPSPHSARVWVERIPVIRRFVPGLFGPDVNERIHAFPTVILAVLLSVVVHAGGIASWMVLAVAVDLSVDAWIIAWVRSAALVAALLPATVGGLGLREGAAVFLLATLGVNHADALSVALLVFSITILPLGVLGGILEVRRLLLNRRSPAGAG